MNNETPVVQLDRVATDRLNEWLSWNVYQPHHSTSQIPFTRLLCAQSVPHGGRRVDFHQCLRKPATQIGSYPFCTQHARKAPVKPTLAVYRAACAEAYQLAGAVGCSAEVLDNFAALAQGEPPPHSWDAYPAIPFKSRRKGNRARRGDHE